MPISFSADDRRAITRRQIKIQQENEAFTSTVSSLGAEQQKLLKVDNANIAFYGFYRTQCDSYENEVRQINGVQSATYTDGTIEPYTSGDLSNSAKYAGETIFFPSSPPYIYLIPKVALAINGYTNTIGTDVKYEQNILNNTVNAVEGLTQVLNFLLNGIAGASSATTTSASNIPGGNITGHVLTVLSTTNFAIGEYIYANSGSDSGIYRITNIVPGTSLTLDSVFPSASSIVMPTLDNTVVGFTNLQRQNLTGGSYQEILDSLTAKLLSLISDWESKLDNQVTYLTSQNDTRATQLAQNNAALSDVNNAKSIIDAWQLLPNTGVGAKYTDTGLSTIQSEISARITYTANRVSEIVAALGSVSQSGETYSGVIGSSYYNRYKWLNIRINKGSGSARRYFAAFNGSDALTRLINQNNDIKNEYDAYFLTKQIKFIDGSPIIQTSNVTNLSIGDKIYILSETQSEIERSIVEIMGTTQLRLDKPVPNTYTNSDLARLFKQLQ